MGEYSFGSENGTVVDSSVGISYGKVSGKLRDIHWEMLLFHNIELWELFLMKA